MPFIGRDWRSPGEAWVKTESLGWQRMKIIESQLYPSCHQNPACSWPPRSESGLHMANHCKRHDDNNSTGSRDGSSSGASSSSSSPSSAESSRGGSVSPSPTSSPEKNVHHLIHPITISSPYGQYSCCSHQHCPAESGSSTKDCCEATRTTSFHNRLETTNAQSMSRSLSRESLRTDDDDDATRTIGGHHHQKLRYNNSVSDFRNTSSPIIDQTTASNETVTSQQQQLLEQLSPTRSEHMIANSAPILMKNGFRIEDNELNGYNEQVDPTTSDEQIQDKSKLRQNSQVSICCCTNNCQVPQNICHPKEPYTRAAPHCRISVRTREVAMYNTISEAFYRLDFCNAIHDIRRFNYICKLLHLLITQNLTSLSGCATKVLFTMLEQVAWEVSSNKRNIHVLKNLLNELKQMIQKYYCWGRPIGSSLLWQQHFDTIERISQIVDGIELSPPKSDSAQISFNNLPVEMIREVLLRLNDYRDLVNSARASPVMRTMIDGQYIWKQLCKYHFTEQQLKSAFNNYNKNSGLPVKQTSNVRGIKYARTSSADGLTSFRNPVSHKLKAGTSTTRQQLEQTSGRRGNSCSKGSSDESSSSYVTRAIRIFDKEGSSMTLGSSRVKKIESENYKRVNKQNNGLPPIGKQNSHPSSNKDSEIKQQNLPSNYGRSSHEIDWERVFHQLRKKFDLKEEYADCLLLCRHCRCLFWKSFGHPCIKSDESQATDNPTHCGFRLNQPCSVIDGSNLAQNVCNCDGLNRQSGMIIREQQHNLARNEQEQSGRRLSVAALSRNFDNRAQGINPAGENGENVSPDSPSNALNGMQAQRSSSQRLSSNDNLGAQLRERNAWLANRRLNGQQNNNNNNNNNNSNNDTPTRSAIRHNELVPKHVAISPQAFLKFFSL